MKELILWISSFFALLISIFWLQVIYFKDKKLRNNNKFPKVSIIIPAHNEEKNILRTINSVLNLDYPKDRLEIIVVDDSSTDNTSNVVKKYRQVKLVYNKHKGLGKASVYSCNLYKKINVED